MRCSDLDVEGAHYSSEVLKTFKTVENDYDGNICQ